MHLARIALLLIALPAAASAAEIYRCVDRGVVSYQDIPCRTPDSGKVVRMPEFPAPSQSSQEDLDALRKRVDAMARERRVREITAEIDGLNWTIMRSEREEAAELDALRQKRGFAANNFIADGWDRNRVDQALVDQMAQVSARYRERTDPARRRIAELRAEQKALTAPPPAPSQAPSQAPSPAPASTPAAGS